MAEHKRRRFALLLFCIGSLGCLGWYTVAGGESVAQSLSSASAKQVEFPPADLQSVTSTPSSGSVSVPTRSPSSAELSPSSTRSGVESRYNAAGLTHAETDSGTALSSQEEVRLLDGSVGPRPASQMDCSFDGGSFVCGSCQTDGDCPAGQGCIANRETRRFECLPSECEEDFHCHPGSVCRVAAGSPPGPLVRRCVPSGSRGIGERCELLPSTPANACQEELICINESCAPRCNPDAPGSCPEGYTCGSSRNGPGCVPDCRRLGCESGLECVQTKEDNYQCLRLVVDECSDRKPCQDGQHCMVKWTQGRGGRFCASSCQSWKPTSCAEGYVCGRGGPTLSSCYRQCDPQDLSTCAEGWLCSTVSEDLQTWGCVPNVYN